MQRDHPLRRFTKADPCPICGGYDTLGRGKGARCFGYYLGQIARCTREEYAGGLSQNRDGTYAHRLRGRCDCGQRHGRGRSAAGRDRPAAASTLRRRAGQRFRSFDTLRAFLRRRYGEGATVRHWIYRDASGAEVLRVLRVDYRAPDGGMAKSYRPCHKAPDGRWLLSRPECRLPLYNPPAILAAPPQATVSLLEGEKCADIAAVLGLPCATTSAHGAQAPWLSDWSPLAGRSVAIVRDEGDRGAEYAARVSALLAELDPPAEAHVVRLPGLADGEDIEQWIAGRRADGLTDADLLAEVVALIERPR